MKSLTKVVLACLLAISFAACSGGSSDSANTGDGGATTASSTFTVTVGDGQVTISETANARQGALTDGCSYNVYIASESGVTADNYGSLADGARYEAVSFPYTISGLDNGKTYYVIVTEVCDGVESTTMDETSASPSDGTVTTTGDDTSGMTPDSIDVTGATAGVEEVEITWSAPSDFAKASADYATENYTVCWEAGANPDSSSPCDDVGRGENSFTVEGLTGGTQYCFGVIQWKENIGASNFGATICATPTAAPTPTVSILGQWNGSFTSGATTCVYTIDINDDGTWDLTYVSGPALCTSDTGRPYTYVGDELTLVKTGSGEYKGTVNKSKGTFTLPGDFGWDLELSR